MTVLAASQTPTPAQNGRALLSGKNTARRDKALREVLLRDLGGRRASVTGAAAWPGEGGEDELEALDHRESRVLQVVVDGLAEVEVVAMVTLGRQRGNSALLTILERAEAAREVVALLSGTAGATAERGTTLGSVVRGGGGVASALRLGGGGGVKTGPHPLMVPGGLILQALHKLGIRPAALPSPPLSAMTGLHAAQSGPPPSVSSTVALSQTVASSFSGPATVATPQSPPVSQAAQQYPWYPKTPLNPSATFSGDKKDEALDTWLRTVPVWVRAKRTLVEEEVITAASYLEGSAARWLNGLVASKGFDRNMHDWAQTHTLVEARWHNPQQAQIATDGLLKLDTRKYKSVRELTTVVERLIVVPGVEYNPQVLLTMFLRCLPTDIMNLLASEARREYHTFESFSKKALDLEVTLGGAQTPSTDGRKKKTPQEWKKKGSLLMMVDSDGNQTEIDDVSELVEGSEFDGKESVEGSNLATNQEEGMYLVYVSAKGEPVKTPPEIETIVAKYPDLFEEPTGVVDREIVHAIEIIPGSKTPKGRFYRMAPAELDGLLRQLKELTEKGWIRPSTSPFGSPVLFVQKKGGTLRMCIDYRGLNAISVKNAEPLRRIDDLLDRVQGCKYYTKIAFKSGYHQIAIRPEDQHKTAFQTRYGLCEFEVMPFGLCNAPGTFQHAMNRIFHDYLDKFVVVYLDDILIFSRYVEAQHVDTVLSLLRQHKYKINSEKCEFGRTRILYLGHEVSADGIRLEDAKVASIRDWPQPQSVTEARSFLGMCGYYHNFVKNYSTITSPLTDLTRLDTPWDWTDECEAAFKRLKHALTPHEVLMVPDPQRPFVATTDASQYGIGAVLAQQEGKKLRPIEYVSKKMPSKKLAKSTYERELYALYKALIHWRHYLLGRFFYLRTDHQTLKWIKTQPVLSDALKRWIEVIDQYDFKLDYLKGEYNKVAKALSRRADYLGALIYEFGLSEDVTRSLDEAYKEDPITMDIINKLHAKDKATTAEFVMVDGLFFLEKAGFKRLVVPSRETLRSLFLGECHDATRHFGYKKTSANLVQRFWWPNMLDDVKKCVETCQVCQRDKPRTQAPLGLLKPLPILAGPGQSISMDFMDTLVTSKNGKRHIFVIVDRLTKYARLIAMPETAKTEHVINLFMDNWVRDFGLPKTIVSGRDVRFTSEMWKKAAEQMGSQLQMTSGNHLEANGQAEQMNRVVQHLLRHYIKPNQDDWDEKLPLIANLYNNVVHITTGVSPNQLHFGWKPRSALDFLLPENRTAATPGTIEFGVQYEKLLQQTVEHIKKSQEAMIASENKHCRQSTFQVGERVWVKASELGQEFGISRKLMPEYFGPWEVLDIVGNDMDGPSYVIRIPGHLHTYPVFHASKLAPFAETTQFPSRRSMLPPTMDGHVDVDDILDHRDTPLLDSVLGTHHRALFRRAELKALVNMHGESGGELSQHETSIITGALDLYEKTAGDAMTPLDSVFCLDIFTKMDLDNPKGRVELDRRVIVVLERTVAPREWCSCLSWVAEAVGERRTSSGGVARLSGGSRLCRGRGGGENDYASSDTGERHRTLALPTRMTTSTTSGGSQLEDRKESVDEHDLREERLITREAGVPKHSDVTL
ncbi:hypothetical protein CBR_g49148 [Chara braunii]|uniref:Integrase catalytic domain-containing protein n=1 Tax=Chara braunii TaxID=69332 RepID=A0A388K4U2_CHABU|nr:hypothetical protein CBR_g49148 [Chara braunii]|eukprot:GBG65074.1 hypothetical protein CBR_g49148 [Chara braunii]